MSIVVGDNCCDDGTSEYLDQIVNSRIIKARSNIPLSMCENWNRIISPLINDDTYIFFLGDDDGILPGSLEIAASLIEKLKCKVLSWNKVEYAWPNVVTPEYRNHMRIPLRSTFRKVLTNEFLSKAHRFEISYSEGPSIYSSFVHSSVLKNLMEIDGQKVFRSCSPDVYSSYAIASLIPNFFKCDFALSINGASHHSNGVSYVFRPSSEITKLFKSENIIHPTLVHSPSVATAEADSLLCARDTLPRLRQTFNFDWMSYLNRLKNDAISAYSLETQGMIVEAIYSTARLQRINYSLKIKSIFNDRFLSGPVYGLDLISKTITLNVSSLDIKDVFHASKFVDAVFSLKYLINKISLLQEEYLEKNMQEVRFPKSYINKIIKLYYSISFLQNVKKVYYNIMKIRNNNEN
jgi:hypothetical protein